MPIEHRKIHSEKNRCKRLLNEEAKFVNITINVSVYFNVHSSSNGGDLAPLVPEHRKRGGKL